MKNKDHKWLCCSGRKTSFFNLDSLASYLLEGNSPAFFNLQPLDVRSGILSTYVPQRLFLPPTIKKKIKIYK